MLTVVLKILSILGILLLILLGVALTLVLLVLFFPITYKLWADRKPAAEEGDSAAEKRAYAVNVRVKANWLFGFFRLCFLYPDPGNLTAKVLWIKLFDSAGTAEAGEEKPDKAKRKADRAEPAKTEKQTEAAAGGESAPAKEQEAEQQETEKQETENQEAEQQDEEEKGGLLNKIKCTIDKICDTISACRDKIRAIHENIAFYRELLLCEDTKGLVSHGFWRLGRILKSIRPRKLRADILFGTGSPDTTGYALGIYGILSPHLNREVNITPDFTQAVLEGEIYAAGHITVFRVLRHAVMLVLDKRLRKLMRRLKERETYSGKDNG